MTDIDAGTATGGGNAAVDDAAVDDAAVDNAAVDNAAVDNAAVDNAAVWRRKRMDTHGAGGSGRAGNRQRARELFRELAGLPEGTQRQQVREELVELHLPLAEYLARRFGNRSESLDDLIQVATIGLLKSIDRFDVSQGVEFSTYATPTILGEIKRHFRDKGWAVRVPRRLQELKLSLGKAAGELSQRHGRAPTVGELAEYLGITREEVVEGLDSAQAYSTVSLDLPESGDEDSRTIADTLGVADGAFDGIEYRESLKPLLEQLPERDKHILKARFFEDKTQTEIAAELGISQMHVSRLLSRTLLRLRQGLVTQ